MKNYLISGILLSLLVFSVLGLSSCETTLSGCPKDVYKDECLRQIIFQIYNADSTGCLFPLANEFEKYWNDQKILALNELCEKENLDKEQFRALIDAYVYNEQEPLREEVFYA